jgi:threonine 3-dehydrogenase
MFLSWYRISNINRANLDISFEITHRFHLTTCQTGFETMISGPSGEMVLDWTV